MTESGEGSNESVYGDRVGGDKIGTGNIQNAVVAIGRGASATVYGGIHYYYRSNNLDTLPFSLRTNIQNFLTHYLGTESHPVPFGGRRDALDRLEQWRTQSEKSFLLLTTPAGRGKSALLTRWAQWLSQPDKIEEVTVVFVPISIRYNTNLPELIFPCIAVQLAALLDEDVPSDYINMAPDFWQSLVGEYLRRPILDGRQLLLIVDGLDEAAWDVGPDLFPLDLPVTTKIVVSARNLAGELPGPKPWLSRLGWERFELAKAFSLETLTRNGVQEVLVHISNQLNALADQKAIADKLYDLTKGDPLLVELYVGWLQDQGDSSAHLQPADLEKIEPDYGGFFNYWWEGQEKLWAQQGETDPMEKKAVITLLYILATTLGPLTTADVKALLPSGIPSSKYQIRQAIKPLRRFIIGDGVSVGYSFSHTRLGDFFAEEFLDGRDRREWQKNFANWGQQVINELQTSTVPDFYQVSRYLLQYHSHHLLIVKAPVEVFLSLLSWEWLQAWHRNTGTYVGFLRDVDTVLKQLNSNNRQAIAQGKPASNIGWEIMCVLCHASVNSLAGNMSRRLLVALRQYGNWTDEQVLFYARQNQDPDVIATALLALAPHLNIEQQIRVYPEALQATQAIRDERHRTYNLIALAPHLPQAVYGVAQMIQRGSDRARILVELAPHLPQAKRTEVLSEVLQMAQNIDSERDRASILTDLVPHLTEMERANALALALQAAQSVQEESFRALILVNLVPHLPQEERADVLNQAVQATQAIQEEGYRYLSLVNLAPHLPQVVYEKVHAMKIEGYRAEILAELAPHLPQVVFEAAQEIHRGSDRAWALSSLVPHLPKAEREEALGQALQAAQAIQDEPSRAGILIALAPHLSEAKRKKVLNQVLKMSQDILNDEDRASILISIAPYMPQAVYEEAQSFEHEAFLVRILTILASQLPQAVYETAQDIESDWNRASILIDLVPHLPETEREETLGQALQVAEEIQDEASRARILIALVPHLPEAKRKEMLNQALQAAQVIQDEPSRAGILIALAPHLSDAKRKKVLNQALEMAQDIDSEWDRAWILSYLAPHLSEEEQEEVLNLALQAAQEIQGTFERVRFLIALVPRLSEAKRTEVLGQALQTVQDIEDEALRSTVLRELAPRFPQGVYEAAQAILDKGYRSRVLRALAPYLPQEVYKATLTTQPKGHTALILARLIDHILTFPKPEKYFIWTVTLSHLKRLRRSSTLSVIMDFIPVISELDDETGLVQTVDAVERISRWWP